MTLDSKRFEQNVLFECRANRLGIISMKLNKKLLHLHRHKATVIYELSDSDR